MAYQSLLKATFVLLSSAAIHDRKETTPRETTIDKISANPYWRFSMGFCLCLLYPVEKFEVRKKTGEKRLGAYSRDRKKMCRTPVGVGPPFPQVSSSVVVGIFLPRRLSLL
jgi:hypothetical protein